MGWLVDNLPPALRREPIWVELYEVFEIILEPLLADIEKRERSRSIFTADSDDLDRMIEESGDVFDVEWNVADDKPLSILWRKDELKFKNSAIPIESMLARSFVGLDSYWDAYYYHKDADYTQANLRTLDQIQRAGHSVDDYILTSRGFLRIDVASMLQRDISQEEIINIIRGKLDQIIPTHIVYDGIKFILSVLINNLNINTKAVEKLKAIQTTAQLTLNTVAEEVRKIHKGTAASMDVYGTDTGLQFDAVPLDFIPLDYTFETGDDVTIIDTPIPQTELSGQLGDGSVVPDKEIQLGDGSVASNEEVQLGEGANE